MNKIFLIVILLGVVGGAFFGGMQYGQSKNPFSGFSSQNFQGLSSEERQELFQGNVGEGLQRIGRGNGFLSGEVIDKDQQTLTLKMADGSSSIVFFSDSTQISKTTEGSVEDVEIGQQIMVSGEQNSDGSYTAKTIQLSPRF